MFLASRGGSSLVATLETSATRWCGAAHLTFPPLDPFRTPLEGLEVQRSTERGRKADCAGRKAVGYESRLSNNARSFYAVCLLLLF